MNARDASSPIPKSRPGAEPLDSTSSRVIHAEQVHFGYTSKAGRQPVLNGLSCELRSHELLAITGPSGCGKSTLLKLLAGLLLPERGQVYVLDREISIMSDADRADLRASTIGFIFQRFNLLPFLDAQSNIELALKLKRLPTKLRREQALDALDYVGLASKAGTKPGQLSGGEQQRVAIARALAAGPQILLCDEPTGSLNNEGAQAVFELLQQLAHDHGRAVALVTHNEHLATRCDRRLMLSEGQLLAHTAVPDLREE